MFEKIWEGLGESFVSRWAITSFGPALVFWCGGLLTWAQSHDLIAQLKHWEMLAVAEQVVWMVFGLIWVAVWATLMEQAQSSLLYLAEGYWPNWMDWLRDRLASRWIDRIEKKQAERERFRDSATLQGQRRYRRLDAELARLPVKQDQTMPTLLGNVLRAAEEYPKLRYGLVASVCWPRLFPLLSGELRKAIGESRAKLNEMIRLTTWSLAFVVWAIWEPWALIGLPIAWMTGWGIIQVAGVFGDLVRAAFDLHRFDLYRALSWPLPQSPDSENISGEQLSEYLFRGVAFQGVIFTHNRNASGGSNQQL